MKKLCSALMVFFALAFIMPKNVFAAEIPDIRSLSEAHITLYVSGTALLRKTFKKKKLKGQQYWFNCSDNKGREYLSKYVGFLTNSLDYKIYKQEITDDLSFYYLTYSGTENVSTISETYPSHINLNGAEDWIIIATGDGINMVDFQSQPAPVENNPPQITPISTNQTRGADVPDFGQIGATYDHNQQNSDRSVTYIFKASGLSESRADEYVNKYISLLTSNNFVQTGYDKKQFNRKRVQATRQSETWTFDYRGSKSISGLSDGNALTLKRVRDPQTGDTSFEIRVAKDLVFAGNYEAPNPPPPGKTTCSDCNNGKCLTCNGTGYYWDGSGVEKPCAACDNGKCRRCKGTGYV